MYMYTYIWIYMNIYDIPIYTYIFTGQAAQGHRKGRERGLQNGGNPG